MLIAATLVTLWLALAIWAVLKFRKWSGPSEAEEHRAAESELEQQGLVRILAEIEADLNLQMRLGRPN